MSRETLIRDSNGDVYSLDNLSTQKWLDGHWSGLDQCCLWLEQKATELFGQRKREQAVELQNLADEMKKELRPQMIERAAEHAKDFPSQLERTAWKAQEGK